MKIRHCFFILTRLFLLVSAVTSIFLTSGLGQSNHYLLHALTDTPTCDLHHESENSEPALQAASGVSAELCSLDVILSSLSHQVTGNLNQQPDLFATCKDNGYRDFKQALSSTPKIHWNSARGPPA